jgi:transposase
MIKQRTYQVNLSGRARQELETFVSRGKKSAREITRARVLLLADEGKTDQEIGDVLRVTRQTLSGLRKKYAERRAEPIRHILKDEPRSGRPIKIDTRVEANLTVLACSDPPDGSATWTLRVLADRLVKLEVIDSISHERVRGAVKKPVEALALGTMVPRPDHGCLPLAQGGGAAAVGKAV